MNGGNALWALTTDSLLALDTSLLEIRLFTSSGLQSDGTFSGGGDIESPDMSASIGSTVALDPTDSRCVGNFDGMISVTNTEATALTINSLAVVRTDRTLGDAILFYWDVVNPITVASGESVEIPAGEFALHLV